jgi:ADP-ribosylglycohydrolase
MSTPSQQLSDRVLNTHAPVLDGVDTCLFCCARAIHLRLPLDQALTEILTLGGDTDTNAAIVGGLVGALHGAAAIPAVMKEAVEGRRVGSRGQPRPAWLQTDLVAPLVEELLEVGPRLG